MKKVSKVRVCEAEWCKDDYVVFMPDDLNKHQSMFKRVPKKTTGQEVEVQVDALVRLDIKGCLYMPSSLYRMLESNCPNRIDGATVTAH